MSNDIDLSSEMAAWIRGASACQKFAAELCRQQAAMSEACGNRLGAAGAIACAERIEAEKFVVDAFRGFVNSLNL